MSEIAAQIVALPDGTRLGCVAPWPAKPEIFDGWFTDGNHSASVATRTSRKRAELAVVNAYLVREIRIQERAEPTDEGYVERNRKIQEGFRMQRALTGDILTEEGEG